jgi:hypothetical protein
LDYSLSQLYASQFFYGTASHINRLSRFRRKIDFNLRLDSDAPKTARQARVNLSGKHDEDKG